MTRTFISENLAFVCLVFKITCKVFNQKFSNLEIWWPRKISLHQQFFKITVGLKIIKFSIVYLACKITFKVFNRCFSNLDILCLRTISQNFQLLVAYVLFSRSQGVPLYLKIVHFSPCVPANLQGIILMVFKFQYMGSYDSIATPSSFVTMAQFSK